MRIHLCCLVIFASACHRTPPAEMAFGPIENDVLEVTKLVKAVTNEPLSSELNITPEEAFYITFELQQKADRPEQLNGRTLALVQDCPCIWALYPEGTRPNLKARPGDSRETTILFSAPSRLAKTRQFPIAPGGRWQSYVKQSKIRYHEFIPPPANGASPYYAIVGAPQPTPGVYLLELYSYPTIEFLPEKTVFGEPLLLWRGRLTVTD